MDNVGSRAKLVALTFRKARDSDFNVSLPLSLCFSFSLGYSMCVYESFVLFYSIAAVATTYFPSCTCAIVGSYFFYFFHFSSLYPRHSPFCCSPHTLNGSCSRYAKLIFKRTCRAVYFFLPSSLSLSRPLFRFQSVNAIAKCSAVRWTSSSSEAATTTTLSLLSLWLLPLFEHISSVTPYNNCFIFHRAFGDDDDDDNNSRCLPDIFLCHFFIAAASVATSIRCLMDYCHYRLYSILELKMSIGADKRIAVERKMNRRREKTKWIPLQRKHIGMMMACLAYGVSVCVVPSQFIPWTATIGKTVFFPLLLPLPLLSLMNSISSSVLYCVVADKNEIFRIDSRVVNKATNTNDMEFNDMCVE